MARLTYQQLRQRFPYAPNAVLQDAAAIAASADPLPRRQLVELISLAHESDRARALLHTLAGRSQPHRQDRNADNPAD